MGDRVELLDLVERLEGPQQRRFRTTFIHRDMPPPPEDFAALFDYVPFPDEDQYTEWRLRVSVTELLELLDRTPDAADVLLDNFILVEPGGRKVVWLSHTHVVACERPEGHGDVNDRLPTLSRDAGDHELDVWSSNASDRRRLTLKALDDDHSDEDEVMLLLHRLVALGTTVSKVEVSFSRGRTFDGILPGAHDLVSRARSRRTVALFLPVSAETGRVLAYHCNPMVELEATLDMWHDHGLALAQAMLENRGPARLAVGYGFDNLFIAAVAPALAVTTCVEELTILLPMTERVVWDAVAQNGGIRYLAARRNTSAFRTIEYMHLRYFWKAALTNGSLRSIDFTADIYEALRHSQRRRGYDGPAIALSDMIATMIRSNPRITSLTYDRLSHDVNIMETRVMPIVHLNRFRPVVQALFDDRPVAVDADITTITDNATGRDQAKDFSALVGSPLVRRHPELLYCLLKAGRDYLLSAPLPPSSTTTDTAGVRQRARPEAPCLCLT